MKGRKNKRQQTGELSKRKRKIGTRGGLNKRLKSPNKRVEAWQEYIEKIVREKSGRGRKERRGGDINLDFYLPNLPERQNGTQQVQKNVKLNRNLVRK